MVGYFFLFQSVYYLLIKYLKLGILDSGFSPTNSLFHSKHKVIGVNFLNSFSEYKDDEKEVSQNESE